MKKKSKYKPKPVRLDNMAWVTGGMLPVSTAKEAILNLGIKNHGALSCLVQGTGTRADAVMLRSAFITARALAMLDLGKEYKPDLDKAQVTIAELIARGDANGRYLYSRRNSKKSVDEYVDENWGVDNSLPYRMGKRLVSLKRKCVG